MKKERPFSELIPFLPEGTFDSVVPYFQDHTIHLTLTRERKSVLGDYRNPSRDTPYHRITVNATLHPYSFLITLLHELAHMLVFIRFGNKVMPHGSEWKNQFKEMLIPYIGKKFFPNDIEQALLRYIQNPKASTCTDTNLYKTLYRYNRTDDLKTLVESLDIGSIFRTEEGRLYKILEKRRTRYRCEDLQNGKMYLFPAIYEVIRVVKDE
ncbi:SprT-like domain-containing protein [Rurimicrobium arvi]|uniref:SprT-like domain-containing protein n=1 Tax=Rurimicrobium arvi TaxID=2049916 RepID=A0ABP8MP22_9BACT